MLSISVIIPNPYDIDFIITKDSNNMKKNMNTLNSLDSYTENDNSLWLSSIYEIWETKDIFYDINTRINNLDKDIKDIKDIKNIKNIKEGIRILRHRKTLGDSISKIVCDHFQMMLDTLETPFFYKKQEIYENLAEKITQLQIDIERIQLDIENEIISYENVIKKIELIDIEKNLIITEINLLKTIKTNNYHIKILNALMKGVYNELSKLLTVFHK